MKVKATSTTSFRIDHIKPQLKKAANKEKMRLHEFVVKILEAHVDYSRNKFLKP